MSLHFDIFSLLVLFGACQGLLLSLFLFFSTKDGIKGKNYLGFFMLILAYNGFETFNWSSGLNDPYLSLFFSCFHFMLIFGLGPSLYVYVKFLTSREGSLYRPVLDYYAPLILRICMRISLIIYTICWGNEWLFNTLSPIELDNWDVMLAEPVSVVVFCIYLVLAVREFRKFDQQRVSAPAINQVQEEITSKWLKILLQCMAVFALVWLCTVLAPMLFDVTYGPHFYIIEVLLVFFIYWVAFAGYYRTKVVYVQPQKTISANSSSLSPDEMHACAALIEISLTIDKLYRDPDLTVSKLAAHVKVNPKMISAVLNQYMKTGFSECINAYRVEEVKERLLNQQYSHLTISGIALESGFNSQATFQRAFKNHTGMSPKEFISLQAQKTA